MAAISSNGTGGGIWSAVGTWAGGVVPAEGDYADVIAGDTVNIDDAAPATIIIGEDHVAGAYAITVHGTLQYLSTAAVDHVFRCKGNLVINSGGSLNIGTVANPIPATRTFTIELNYSASLLAGKYGLRQEDNGIIIVQGAELTHWNTTLASGVSATDTDITTTDITGWVIGDVITIASSTSTAGETEERTISNIVGTTITVAALTYAHSADAEVLNITRNLNITSYNASYNGYIYLQNIGTIAECDFDWVEFSELGISTAEKYGISCTSGLAVLVSYNGCTMHDFGPYTCICGTSTYTNTIIYKNVRGFGGTTNTAGIFTDCRIVSNTTYGMYSGTATLVNTDLYSNVDNTKNTKATFTGCKCYATRFNIQSILGLVMDNCDIYDSEYGFVGGFAAKITNTKVHSNTHGLYEPIDYILEDCEIGTAGINTSDDFYVSADKYMSIIARNTKFDSPTLINALNAAASGSRLESEDHGQVQYYDRGFYKYGNVVRDSTTKKTSSYSMRFDRYWAADAWLEYELTLPVKDGESVVASAWLRKNASYTSANRPKIKLSGMGITEVEDQMSDVTDTWEKVTVSGTPTRTGMAKLTIMTYLTNAGASAWCDFDKTGLTMPVLNTLEGSFWSDGHMAQILFDTGSITAAEFWKTLTADIDKSGSFANLFKDYIDAAISSRNATTPPTVDAIADQVWDEILTGATHNIATSAGKRVREIGAFAIHSGTAQAGNSHSITIAANASPSNAAYHGIYNRNLLVLTDNTGVGQTRTIVDYDAITKVCVVDRDWRISPDATTAYQIVPDDTPLTVDHGVARGGTNRTITIRTHASSDDNAYLCNIVTIIAGEGRGQARLVDSYDGTNNIVTICGDDWVVTPDTTSIYVMMPYGVACAACMGNEALAEIKSECDTALSDVDLDKHDSKMTGLLLSQY